MSKAKKELKKNFKNNPYLLLGTVITGIIVLVILLGVFWTPYNPTTMNSAEKLQGIYFRHPMGTDNMGRDVLSRVMYGSRITLLIAIGTVAIGSVVGTIIGALTGYFGGMFDEVTMRIIDALFAFPSILLALVIALFGRIVGGASKKPAKSKAPAQSVPAAAAAIPAAVEEEELADDMELVAVIAAAVAAFEGKQSTDGFVVRSIRKARRK